MKALVRKSRLAGEISVPGSKSHTIRAVAFAAMADGVSKIRGPLFSGDTMSSLDAAAALGASIDAGEELWEIGGVSGNLRPPKKGCIDLGNSGTSLRIFTALASLGPFSVSFDGDSSLRTRPMGQLLSALEKLGVKTSSTGGRCPLSVTGPQKGGRTSVEGRSSQFVTALIMAAPLAQADTEISVTGLNERPYLEITLDWLASQKTKMEYDGSLSAFRIPGGQKYAAFDKTIPADFSTATFPLAAAAVTGGEIRIKNLDFSDRQGDKEVFKYLEMMGMQVARGKDFTVVRPGADLSGIDIDMNATPDALPAMAVVGCFAKGRTTLRNVPQARIKETDRIACMARELKKMGADVAELPDGLVVAQSRLRGAALESYADHRIAMALAIAAMGADGDSTISQAESASVTYPAFYDDFRRLGANIEFV